MKISLWVYMSVFVHVRVCACLLGAVQFDNYERGEVGQEKWERVPMAWASPMLDSALG